MKPVYEYRPRFRGGPASEEIIRHEHELGGKRAAPPKPCPRTDVDDTIAVGTLPLMNTKL